MAGDSNYANVSLHLPFNGPAGATSHFDRAPTQKTLTNSVGTALNATQSKYNSTSLYLNGVNDTISAASHTDFNFGTGDFTIELWVYGTRTNQPHSFPRILANGAYLAANAWNLVLIASSGALFFDTYNGSAANGSSIGTLVENSWNHIAVTRQSGTLRTFLNGTLVTTKTDNQNLSGAYTTYVGSDTISFFKGYIDDLRITKGVARYTSNFTPVENQIGGLDIVDPFYSNTSLLINSDTTTLADQSPVVKTITKVGNADVSFLNSKAGLGSIYFDGTGDYLTIPDSSAFDLGTGDFTLECWYYPLSVSGAAGFRGLISQRTNANVDHAFSLFVNQNNAGFGFAFTLDGSTNNEQYFGSALTVNTWYHVAVSRVGANLYFAVNGVVTAATGSASAIFNSSQPVQIGRLGTYTSGDLHGYLDSVRVTKGTARYTAAFTPPNYSLSNYIPTSREDPFFSNVGLLLPFDGPAGSTNFFDRSPSPKAVTVTGQVALSAAQSKFNGTSALFDGSVDYLTLTDNVAFEFGAGDFTVELWCYPQAGGASFQYLIGKYGIANNQRSWSLMITDTGVLQANLSTNGTSADIAITTSYAMSQNQWHHLALSRQGSSIRLFANGALVGSATNAAALFDGTSPLTIGYTDTSAWYFSGYIDDLRITKGVARYTSNFTPGTAPNPISGLISPDPYLSSVKLLVNADQNPVVDKSQSSRTLTLNGNAARSLVDSKFGPASLIFDGTDDFITCGHSVDLNLATDAFTIEAWIKTSTNTAIKYIVRKGSPTYSTGYVLALNASGKLFASIGVTTTDEVFVGATTVPINTWSHVAVTRSGSTIRLFINGVLDATGTLVGTPADNTELLYVGRDPSATVRDFNGYIDELRITKGVARYTGNFTVPTSAYEEYIVSSWQATQGSISLIGQIPVFESYTPFLPVQGSVALTGQTAEYNTGYVASQGTVLVSGQIPVLPTNIFVSQGSLLIAGQIPELFFGTVAAQGSIAVSGQNPAVSTGFFAQQRDVGLSGQTPFLVTTISGETAEVAGRGFQTLPTILGDYDVSVVTGGTFGTVSKIYGGALVVGSPFKATPALTALADQTGYVSGRGFSSSPTIAISHDFVATVQGQGFSSKSTVVGGSIVVGRAFSSPLAATIDAPISLSVIGQGFQSRPTVVADYQPAMWVTGRGFVSGIGYSTVTGRGFTQNAVLKALETSNFAEAFVFNLVPANEEQNLYSVSRYQNYPFQHLTRIANEYYGVKADGLYRLTGEYDAAEDVLVNGTIKLNEDDLSAFNSQNIPYIYLNGDDDYTTTAFVDDVEQPAFSSGFNGRRVKLARGSKGRYWYFKIEGIKSLLGVEYRPEKLARKVK